MDHGDLVEAGVGGHRLPFAGQREPAALVQRAGGRVRLGHPQAHLRRVPVAGLLMVVKSAHVYQSEFGYLRGVLAEGASG
jgi:hypothetical protein